MNQQDIGRLSGLNILAAGKKTANLQSRLKKWRTLNAYALVYITEGSGSFESNETREVEVKGGDCFFLFPGVSHYYGPPSGTYWKEIWLLFRGPLAESFFRDRILDPAHPVHTLSSLRRKDFHLNLETLVEIYKSRSLDYRLKICSLLYHCLLQIVLAPDGHSESGNDVILLEEMKHILQRHLSSDKKISDFFFSSRMSYHTMRMEFLRLSGESPGRFLNDLRMQHAQEQLLWSEFSVQEISRGLGFTDPQYFSRAFRNHTGRSPREFRNRYHLIR